MIRACVAIVLCAALGVLTGGFALAQHELPAPPAPSAPADDAARPALSFHAVPVEITCAAPLAVYQITIAAPPDTVRIVGIEGGTAEPFRAPPHYDPRAMMHETVIIGAFSTRPAHELPSGTVRVATLHLEVRGDPLPDFDVTLDAAAGADGADLDATVTLLQDSTE